MIITFTQKIDLEPRFQPEFFFNRIYTAGGTYFHVSVFDKDGNFCHFTMTEVSGKWKIVNGPQPPGWVMSLEDKLDKIICQGVLS